MLLVRKKKPWTICFFSNKYFKFFYTKDNSHFRLYVLTVQSTKLAVLETSSSNVSMHILIGVLSDCAKLKMYFSKNPVNLVKLGSPGFSRALNAALPLWIWSFSKVCKVTGSWSVHSCWLVCGSCTCIWPFVRTEYSCSDWNVHIWKTVHAFVNLVICIDKSCCTLVRPIVRLMYLYKRWMSCWI